MPTSSVSVTTPAANSANATGFMQSDGFVSPVTLGSPIGTNGGHSVGAARLPSGTCYTVQNNITAHAGGGQANAVALIVGINNVTTVGTAADSVILPTTAYNANTSLPVGQSDVIVRNSAAANAMAVFPPTGGTINGGLANASVSLAAGAFATYSLIAANTWIQTA